MNEDLLIQEVVKLRENVDQIKENMLTKTDKPEIMSALDAVMKSNQDIKQELVFIGSHLDRHEKRLDDHEVPIAKLQLDINPAC
ncbi:MAG: hypothetical protein UY92_C0014G0064 [Candidatus Magasanikbacteria bacterium GW2011_GWA2_56_11]|uniref:Uncharacterized protein n=1 Tax=Candidatus Magasanikbacteria bacterium GW2011_GWA2_56_11 TaxID=1619044 RepID=A0A0G2B8H7_9BACT|nr:MAG: hypothetical protein UY92_C0014G0064 [Candidatus Magasanikbacteria bacterium GW2011_GWA2_56_11]